MTTSCAEELSDRIEWIATSVELQHCDGDGAARVLLQRLDILQARMSSRADTGFHRLSRGLTLTETEVQVVGLLCAMRSGFDAQTRIRQHARAADLTLDTIRSLIYGTSPSLAAHDELGADGTLRRFAIVERNDDHGPNAHESKQTWTIAPRILSLLHGRNAIDPTVARIARTRTPSELTEVETTIEARQLVRSAVERSDLVIVSGPPGVGRRTLLTAAASELGRVTLEIDARRFAKDPLTLKVQLRTLARECRLLGRVPMIGNLDALDEDRIELVGTELVALVEGPVLVTTGLHRPKLDWDRPVIVVEMPQPTSAQRASLWKKELGDIGAQDVEHLATHYPLAPALIARAAAAAKARAGGKALTAEDVHAGIRAVLDDRVGQFAKRVTVTQTWEDLVLPQEQVDSITELMARIRERRRVYEDWGFAAKVGKGLGTSALFSGPPGTGKTMVAALIARDLGLELYQVDLGKVVSKYIGETEKNLAALFDAAEAGHAVILFDEADALFGKRTDVKSSNDRYANLETNYLLQRLETFTGICLLTSNHESNIDPAFLRRLSLHLRFDLPDVAERAQLWRAMMPSAAPVDGDVDVERLAQRYAMSGGYIRNAALRAAFLAANEDSAITAVHLERAARREYEAMGKIAAS
jgi:AAA+ superfamily predicted ATPase